MSNRERILDTARALTLSAGTIPSLDTIAAAAGVSKGGLMHHFRSRAALVEGLAEQMITMMDSALAAAVEDRRVVETWLRLSMSREEADLYRALLLAFTDLGSSTGDLLGEAAAASARWERLLEAELGDPVAASAVRLLGDGLVMNAVTGDAVPSVEALLAWIGTKGGAA